MSAALSLQKAGIDYVIVEREKRAGGLCITDERDGFYFDATGHWLHLRDERIKNLVDETAGLSNFETVVRRTHIYSNGVYTQYPFQSNLFGLPPSVQKECLKGFINAWIKKSGKKNIAAKTFEQWVVAHMGDGIAKHFMIPYNHKLWTVHPSEMTPLWCQIYVPIPTLDEVIDGLVEAPERRAGYNATFIYPKKGGIQFLSDSLLAAVQSKPKFATSVESVNLKKKTARLSGGETIEYDYLINSSPLKDFILSASDAPKRMKDKACKLIFQSVLYYNVALKKNFNVPGSHWIYVPETGFVFYRAGFSSNAVKSVAPKGNASAYIEISHRGDLPKADSKSLTVKGLLDAKLIDSESDIIFMQEKNIRCAYVIFDKNYDSCVPPLMEFLAQNDVLSAGRYGKWTYNSMETALQDGMSAAEKIAASVRGGR